MNSNDQLDLKGSCLVGCDVGISTTFTFNLYLLNSTTSDWTPFTNASYYFTHGTANTELTILKELFADFPAQTIWKIELVSTIYYSANESFQGVTSKTIYVNFSPLPGTCDVLPKNGTTNTLYVVMCDLWSDSDGSITNYAFYGMII